MVVERENSTTTHSILPGYRYVDLYVVAPRVRMDRQDRSIVSLASHAVAGRNAHINWYYYGPERQYRACVAHISTSP